MTPLESIHNLGGDETMNDHWEDLIRQMQKGNRRALSRMITRVENRESGWQNAMGQLYPKTGRARVFGITGAPGTGKSTLTKELSRVLLEKGLSIGIIAVDPSSPFSHGALLGDRLRMQELSEQPRVFIRSMATRGAMGGLCQAARDVTRILDAFGKDIVLIETVGVGQDEIDIVRVSEAVLVVCVPGQGDGIQAIKAGIMEIADFFVVNKADCDGAEELAQDIQAMLALSANSGGATPPVLKTSARSGQGIRELADVVWQTPTRKKQFEKKHIREEIIERLTAALSRRLQRIIEYDGRVDRLVEMIAERKKDPYSAVEGIVTDLTDQAGLGWMPPARSNALENNR